ncbi:DNA-directed RNA polymerase I subunit rpa49 [Gaertneriomyces sp. JEL0708]|nr:DNA-directed RNA polymerase I subunit rpa49 [Gaertneriomyces sp. JEL0708]
MSHEKHKERSKKRKSTAASSVPSETVLLKPSVFEDSSVDAPLLVSFPDFPANPNALAFQTFVHKDEQAHPQKKRRRILVGQTPKIEYAGDNYSTRQYCRYVVALHDKNTGDVTFHETDIFRPSTMVKTLKRHEAKHIGEKNMDARKSLGEAFGTRKRRQQLKAEERNQVDVGGLADIADHIKGTIDEKAASLPSRETIRAEARQDRGIPPYNPDAASPAEVYHLDDIISPAEFASIRVKPLWRARHQEEVKQILEPIKVTEWVRSRLHTTLQRKEDKSRVPKLLYLAYLMRFYGLSPRDLKSEHLASRMGGAPQIVVDTLLNRFTEFQEDQGVKAYRIASKLKDMLLAYILVLCLMLDDYKVDVAQIAAELKISVTKVTTVAKELGCKAHMGGKAADGSNSKRMALVVPLTFPQRTR